MPFETTPEDLSMPTLSGCPLCDRQSLLIYPVRYAIACPRGAPKAPALTGHFRIDERAPQSVSTAKYTLRALRAGYLYTYDEKRKLLRAYMVIENGMLWRFPPGIAPPAGDAPERFIEQACPASDTAYESYGRCVDVLHTPGSDEATRLWIGWSNVRWTRELVFKKIESEANAVNTKIGRPVSADAMGAFHVLRRWIKTGSLEKAVKEETKKASDIPATQEDAANEAWEEASTRVGADGKRVSVIDTEALKRFPQEYQQALDAFRPTWEALVQAHADWLKSLLLAEWMAGNHDVKDLRSGYAYSESCAQAIGAAAGTEACKKVLDDWLNGQTSDIRNLYARALMFNHEQLMKAADAHVHASDIPYENFLNIYKLAFDQIKDLSKADNLRDRLVITTANQVVDVLTKAARNSAVGFITIRLAMQSGVRIKRSEASKLAIRDWTLEQVKTLGVKLDGDRTSQRAAATQVGKQVLRAAPAMDMNIVAYEMDVDTLVKNGKLEAGAIKAIRVPGVDATKRWLGSSTDFNLGIVTMIFQLATLHFATKEWEGRDQFNHDEAELKLAAAVVSILGTVIETASITIIKAPAHPLSTFIMKQWAGASEWAGTGIRLGRGLGTLGGLIFAGQDLMINVPESYRNEDHILTSLYSASGVFGSYIAAAPLFNLPFFWPVLVASILSTLSIALYKASAIKDWLSRCKLSKGEHYRSLDDEIKAFNSAIGG
ncbi:T6SS effector BTH_I2691 family protein [Burkholderia gladioli]|uniref:T6SS effector BTH_I2691 family protein n=1 Tax=Burkholderia gladioli TaxID=28095 RepID=UPI001FC7F937|nr:T6SS effector BTH_I2691 family protein [Burkholderia gladioli]